MGKKIALVIGYGQSNEAGSGNTHLRAAFSVGYAGGIGGSGRSPFVYLQRLLAAEGHYVHVESFAVGGTGLLVNWTGYLRTYFHANHTNGQYLLPTVPNGLRYRVTNNGATLNGDETAWLAAAAAAPGGNAVGTTFTYGTIVFAIEAAQPQDVNNRVAVFGDTAYDPRQFIAPMIAAITRLKSQGFEVWVCTSGHQGDFFQLKALVAQAQVNLIRRQLAAGADRVYMGVTNRDLSNPGSKLLWEASNIHPTALTYLPELRQIVAQSFTSDPRVRMGPDLSGVQEHHVDVEGGTIKIHLRDTGVRWAGKKWRDAITV